MTAVERYLRLGLQLGRHAEGVVDAYAWAGRLVELPESVALEAVHDKPWWASAGV